MASLKERIRSNTDTQMCYKLQHSGAFAAIGGDAVVEVMKSYLPDLDFYGFGTAKAAAAGNGRIHYPESPQGDC